MIGPKTGAIITAVLWGMTYILTTDYLPHHPEMVAAMRALVGAAFLFALQRAVPPRDWWGRILILGTLNVGIFFGFFFVGAMRLQGGVAAIFQALGPVVVLLLAWMILRRRPNGLQFISVILGLLGVSLVVLKDGASVDAIGVGAALVSVVSLSLGGVMMNRWGKPPIGFAAFTGWQLLVGGVELLIVALLLGDFQGPITGTNIAAFAVLGIVLTGIPFLLWFRAIEEGGAVNVMPFILLTPLTALALDAIFHGIMPAPLQILGVLIVVASLLVNQRAAKLAARA